MKQALVIAINFLLLMCFSPLLGQTARYELRMEKPENHYFQVDFILSGYKNNEIEVKLPVWAPGSYLVREFSKNINEVKAVDEKGLSLEVVKKSKNAWVIKKGKAKEVKVSYEVYAFELTVRTSFLDKTHGFVAGTGVFMYTEETRNKPGKLTVYPHSDFSTITTALPIASEALVNDGGTKEYTFSDYDYLVDCPIEIGNHTLFDFTAAGVKHTVAMYGWGNYDVPTLQRDMAKIVEAATEVFGQNPNKDYVFIIHNVTNAEGGLEHMNSTTLSVNRYTYQGDAYLGFLSLVAHEYFHVWNVKRMRAFELGPFDYDKEAYTSLLWVMEGFTSYYDELLLLRAGFYTPERFLAKLQGSVNYVEGTPGSRVQPLAHASFDAWIKAYRPNENSSNTTMSYYSRGGVVAALLDAKIVEKFQGKKSLDDFLQVMYKKYFEQLKRGFTAKEFKQDLSTFLGENMDDFYANYIDGTKIPDYASIFEKVGVKVRTIDTKQPYFGADLSQSGNVVTIRSVKANTSAEKAGLSPKDEIIACNGLRVTQRELESILAQAKVGTSLSFLIARDNVMMTVMCTIDTYEWPRYQFELSQNQSSLNNRNYWLRTK